MSKEQEDSDHLRLPSHRMVSSSETVWYPNQLPAFAYLKEEEQNLKSKSTTKQLRIKTLDKREPPETNPTN